MLAAQPSENSNQKLTFKMIFQYWIIALPTLLFSLWMIYLIFTAPDQPNQIPRWIVVCFPLIFVIFSSYIIYLPFKQDSRKTARNNPAIERPADPWYADYPWNPTGEQFTLDGISVAAVLGVLTLSGLGMGLIWHGLYGTKSWVALICGIPIALLAFGSLLGILQRIIARTRYGSIWLKFTRFPYAAGEDIVLVLDSEIDLRSKVGRFDASLVFYDYYVEIVDKMERTESSDGASSSNTRIRERTRRLIEVSRERVSLAEFLTDSQISLKFTGAPHLSCRSADKEPKAEWEKAIKPKAHNHEQELRYKDGSTSYGFSAKRQNTGERFCQLEIEGQNNRNPVIAIIFPEYKANFRIPIYTLLP